jgi:hypothetical protein
MSKKVEILLGKDGSVRVEAFGFKGESCEEATAFLDKIFGKAKKLEHKDSYYETDTVKDFDVDGLPGGHCG